MANLATAVDCAVAERAATGATGRMATRLLAAGPGWIARDVVCSHGPGDARESERHAAAALAVVVAGTFQYRGAAASGSSSCTAFMAPGALFLGNAGSGFECGHEHGHGDRCISFHFDAPYFDRLASDVGLPAGSRRFDALRVPPVPNLAPVIARACAGLVQRDAPWEEIGLDLASFALGRHDSSAIVSNPDAGALARVTRVVRLIESRSDEPLPLSELARAARLSPYHFLRMFQTLTGVTPHQYVRRVRLRHAALALKTTTQGIARIAFDAGFGDVSNFNRGFRAEFGCSPRRYRTRLS